jgi:peptidoglycan-N-acetylglucosamine deacetylase
MYGPSGKVAGGAAATLPVTGFTSGTGILFMVVLGTVLIALGVALTRFIPRRQLLGPTGRGDYPPGRAAVSGKEMKIIKHIRVPLTVVSVVAVAVLMSAAATASSVKAAAPTATTLAASNVTSTTVTLNGSVNPGGLATTTWFQWNPPDGPSNTILGIGSGATAVALHANITGLMPSTAYSFQVYAWNSKGQKNGALMKFTTSAAVGPSPSPSPTSPSPSPTSPSPSPTSPSPSPSASPTSAGTIYLTFDDGPTAGYTNLVLNDLNAAGAHATFFEIGQSTYTDSGMCPSTVVGTPAPSYATCLANAGNAAYGNYGLVQSILAAGNQIATHSWDHPNFTALTTAQTATEISQARSLQVAVTGRDSKLFRFPFNQVTAAALSYLSSQGMQSIGADIDPSDWNWQSVTDAQVISAVKSQLRDGAVIQLHDGQDVLGRDGGKPGYLPQLLIDIKAAGYSFGLLQLGSPVTAQFRGSANNHA